MPEKQLQQLVKSIEHYAKQDGVHPTAIPSLFFIRESVVTEPVARVNETSFCIVFQGAKEVLMGEACFRYGPADYIVASIDMPVTGHVIKASPDAPYLALKLEFTPSQVLEVLGEAQIHVKTKNNAKRAMFVEKAEPALLDAVARLATLLETPQHISVLAPLVTKEVLYWVLQGPNGDALAQMATEGTSACRVRAVIEYLLRNFDQSFRMEEFAEMTNMSVASLHRHFKEVTAMTPLQFQKHLRLQEARRLLLSESIAVAEAAYQVGYESQSQFSREYSRMFGVSPRTDINQWKCSQG